MHFETIFLEKSDLQKFKLLRLIKSWTAPTFTINDLSQMLHWHYSQTYLAFQALCTDQETLLAENPQTAPLRPEAFRLTLDQYRVFLLQQSIPWCFLDAFVQGPPTNLNAFCEQFFVSRSTLLRKIAPLKSYLARYQIRFSYADLTLVGDEYQIRLALFVLYWTGYHDLSWPLADVDYAAVQQLQQTIDWTPTDIELNQAQDRLIWGIAWQRCQTGHPLTATSSTDLQRLIQDNPFFPANLPPLFNDLSPEISQLEYQFAYFIQMARLSFQAPLTPRSRQLYQHFAVKQDCVWRFSQRLLNFFAPLCSPDKRSDFLNNHQLRANLLRLALGATVMGRPYPTLHDFYDRLPRPSEKAALLPYIQQFFQSLPLGPVFQAFHQCQIQLEPQLFYLLTPYTHALTTTSNLQVRLLLEDDLATSHLRHFLSELAWVNLLDVATPPQKAEFIITSLDATSLTQQAVHAQMTIPIFSWPLDATEADFYRLWQQLSQQYQLKTG